jgi:hypothetical protein
MLANLSVVMLIDSFLPMINLSESGKLLQILMFTYFAFLIIFRVFVLCLKISLKKTENNGKISFKEILKLFWSISKKTN